MTNILRRHLVTLKVATLQAQAVYMGLKAPGEDVSAAALSKIETDVAALSDADLPKQITHWTELNQRALAALATKTPTGNKPGEDCSASAS